MIFINFAATIEQLNTMGHTFRGGWQTLPDPEMTALLKGDVPECSEKVGYSSL